MTGSCARGGYALSILSDTNKGCTVATQALTLDATNAEVAKLAEHLDTALQSGHDCVNLTISCDVDGQTSLTTTTVIFGVLGVLLAVAVLLLAALFAVRRVLLFRQLRARRAADLETQVRSAIRMIRSFSYPAVFVRGTDFVKLGKLTMHEELRDAGLLVTRDTLDKMDRDHILFFSHQYTTHCFSPVSSPL